MIALAHRSRGFALEALRTAAGLGAVLALAAGALALLDGVPSWLVGDARAVRRAATVDEVERRLGARLFLPAYFPSTLRWPPARIRFTLGPPGAAALGIDGRDGAPRLLLVQTVAPGAIPQELVPDAALLDRSPVGAGVLRGTISRIVQDGEMGWQLTWEHGGRSLLLRSRGPVEELLRMARSAREAP